MKRVTKLHVLDAGLLAALKGRLRLDRTPFGPLLETFVLSELLKPATGAPCRTCGTRTATMSTS